MEQKREEDSNFKFVIASRGTERGRGGRARLSLRPRCQMAWAGGRTATALRQFKAKGGSGRIRNAEGERRGARGDKQINLQSEWGGLPRLPSSLLLYLSLPPETARDPAARRAKSCFLQWLYDHRLSPPNEGAAATRTPPSHSPLPSFEVRNLSLRKC